MKRFNKEENLNEIMKKFKTDYVEINTEKSLYSLLQSLAIEELSNFKDYQIKIKINENYKQFDAKIGKIFWQKEK